MFLFTPSLKNSHWAQSLAPWVLISSQVSQNFYRLTEQFEAKRSNCSTKSFLRLVPNYVYNDFFYDRTKTNMRRSEMVLLFS